MKYDYTESKSDLEYGICKGNDTILFIKGGNGGTISGYQNKYIKIANNIKNKFGATVIVSNTPLGGDIKEYFNLDMEFIEEYINEQGFKDYEIYGMGYSRGGTMLCNFAYRVPKIKRLLLINVPLMIKWFGIKDGINKFSGERLTCIYGDNDPSYSYLPLLEKTGVKICVLKDTDHNFTNKLGAFIGLCDKHLFND